MTEVASWESTRYDKTVWCVLKRRCAWVSCLLSCLPFFASAGPPLRRRLLVSAPLPVCVCVAGFWSLGDARAGRFAFLSCRLRCISRGALFRDMRGVLVEGGGESGRGLVRVPSGVFWGRGRLVFFWVFWGGGVLCSWCGFFGFWWVGSGFASLFSRRGVGACLGLLGGARSGALVVVQPFCFWAEEEEEGGGGWLACPRPGRRGSGRFLSSLGAAERRCGDDDVRLLAREGGKGRRHTHAASGSGNANPAFYSSAFSLLCAGENGNCTFGVLATSPPNPVERASFSRASVLWLLRGAFHIWWGVHLPGEHAKS